MSEPFRFWTEFFSMGSRSRSVPVVDHLCSQNGIETESCKKGVQHKLVIDFLESSIDTRERADKIVEYLLSNTYQFVTAFEEKLAQSKRIPSSQVFSNRRRRRRRNRTHSKSTQLSRATLRENSPDLRNLARDTHNAGRAHKLLQQRHPHEILI